MDIFEISHLYKRYKTDAPWVNNNITLQIAQGEIFGLLGDNGAGKSTLVKQIVNLLKPTRGTIKFHGRDVQTLVTEMPLYVGYMPQDTHALNMMTVGEALYFTAHLRGLSKAEAMVERERLLDVWQIGDLKNQPSTKLSGGQRRLLRLAVAMAGKPPVLILDEPTNDLDPLRRKLVWDVLRDVNAGENTTIIFITHDAIEAEKIIERVGIMRAGELVAVGKPSALKRQLADRLRLDVFCDAVRWPDDMGLQLVQAGHWRMALDWDDVEAVMGVLKSAEIDDLSLTTATLEDLYLHYAEQGQTNGAAS